VAASATVSEIAPETGLNIFAREFASSMQRDVNAIDPIEVDIWSWSLDQPTDDDSHDMNLLSGDERDRSARFVKDIDRWRYIAGRGGLRRVLASYLDMNPKDISFCYNEWGKPALAVGGPMELRFNLSHSTDRALLAVCAETEIGVDIEEIRPLQEDVAGHFFSAAECSDLSALPEADRLVGFYRCWTRKEAFVKAHGEGLSLSLKGFDVSLDTDEDQCLLRRLDPEIGILGDWTVRNLDVIERFRGALAVRSGGRHVRVRYRSRRD
jgi:4'-phosphopantetheinyl transferase